jgi:hypothetical protein
MNTQRTDGIVIDNGTVISSFVIGNIARSKKVF